MTPAQIFLINSWRARAIAIASRMAPTRWLDLDDAVGEALYALTNAAKNWPGYCERNAVDFYDTAFFGNYVNRCVAGRIREVIRSSSPLTRKYHRIYLDVCDAYQNGETHDTMAKMSGATVPEVSQVMAVMTESVESFDYRVHGDILLDDDDYSGGLLELLDLLDTLSSTVVEYRVLDGMSFQEIGTELNISTKRTRDVYAKAIAQLRDMYREQNVECCHN